MKIFVSYCHQNSDWVDDNGKYQLIPWLKRQLGEDVSFWTDHILNHHVGEEYRRHIYDNIQDSDIALLLISQEFASSDFIYNAELPWIKERFDRNELRIIPLLISQLSRGGRKRISWIFDLQTIPNDVKPLLDYTASDIEFSNIKIAILNALEEKIESIYTEKEQSKNTEQWPEKNNDEEVTGIEHINNGENNSKNNYEVDSIESYIKAAEKGDVYAQNHLGTMYHNGNGAPQNYAKAFEWYAKAAELGCAEAQYNLGYMYSHGEGVFQDYTKAVEWYTKAAEQGCANAQNNLGTIYYNGKEVPQDYAKAVELYTKAAQQGCVDAQFYLGYMYSRGDGVSQCYAKAVEWYTKAAEHGYAYAQYCLGFMCQYGQGVPQNHAKAVEWYRKAAEQGNVNAQYNLGVMYYNGQGVSQDHAEAIDWYTKAADQGHTNAQEALKKLKQN